MTEFMHGNAVHFRAAQFFRRSWAHGDLPAKIGPLGDLGPSHDRSIQNAGAAIDDPYGASFEVGLLMEIRGQHGVPETERPPKRIRPGLGHVDPHADIAEDRLSQIVKFRARRFGAGPVRSPLFLGGGWNRRSTTEPGG